MLGPLEFGFESVREIVRAVLKEHNKAEGEKNKENEPKKPANERHVADITVTNPTGQRPARPQTSH